MSEERKLPEGWECSRLEDHIELKYGKSLPAKKRDNSGFAVFGSNGPVGHHSKPLTQGPTIIVGRKGSIGEIHFSDKPCSPIDTTYYIDDFHGQPPAYWKHFLKHLHLAELNRATALPGLSRKDVYALKVTIPPIEDQKRIVAKIESLQERSRAAKGHLEQIPDLLNKLRQSVLAAAFRGDLTKEWRAKNPNIEPATELLKRIKKERRTKWEQQQLANYKAKGKQPPKNWKEKYKEPAPVDTDGLPELPGGWCWARVKELGEVTLGRQRAPKYHSGDNMRSYLRVKNVFEDRIDISDVMKMDFSGDEFEKFRLVHGDILLNEGQSLELVGRPAMFNGEIEDVCFTNTLVRFRAYQQVLPRFALYLFLLYLKNGRFMQIASWSTNIAHLGAGRFAELEFSLPPIDEQQEIVTLLDKVSLSIENVKSRREDMHKQVSFLEHGMLAKAFRGELVVLG